MRLQDHQRRSAWTLAAAPMPPAVRPHAAPTNAASLDLRTQDRAGSAIVMRDFLIVPKVVKVVRRTAHQAVQRRGRLQRLDVLGGNLRDLQAL